MRLHSLTLVATAEIGDLLFSWELNFMGERL
jgi:hypothetical protein